MKTLEQIRKLAQQTADRDNKPVSILNLNRFAPLYVVRDHCPDSTNHVESVFPSNRDEETAKIKGATCPQSRNTG